MPRSSHAWHVEALQHAQLLLIHIDFPDCLLVDLQPTQMQVKDGRRQKIEAFS